MQLSHRAKITPASPIRKLAPYADHAKKRGIKIYHLNIGQPDLPTPAIFFDEIKKYLARDESKTLAYSSSEGFSDTQLAFKEYYSSLGIPLEEKNILITTGGSEGILYTMMAVADPGEEILTFEPFYANYQTFATMAGLTIKPITLKVEDGFKLPPQNTLESNITPKTRAIIIANPDNPTGKIYKRQELEALCNLALEHNLFLISDETYREFAYGENKHYSLLEFQEARDRVIIPDSASKRFNICGARIGAVISHNEEVLETVLKFGQARLAPPTLGQIGVIPLLRDSKKYTDPFVEEFKARTSIVYDSLKDVPGVVINKPEGAFYIFVKLPVKDSENFCRFLLEKFDDNGESVMLAPGPGFYSTDGLGHQEVRIACMLKQQDLRRAMEILKKAIEKQP